MALKTVLRAVGCFQRKRDPVFYEGANQIVVVATIHVYVIQLLKLLGGSLLKKLCMNLQSLFSVNLQEVK